MTKAPSTLIRFQMKTELFCSRYGYRPHYNAENDHRKRSHSKTLSRVERFENNAFLKRCFLVWTVKTMLSENDDVIKMPNHSTVSIQNGGQALPCGFNFAPISHAHLGYNSVFKQIRRCSVDSRKRYENDKCGRKSF